MTRKPDKTVGRRQLSPAVWAQAMLRRVKQRIAASGSLKIPAVPGLLEKYVEICAAIFSASGRDFTADETESARTLIANKLRDAYLGSPRSKIVIGFEAEPGCPLGYSIDEEVSTIADAYERWIGTSEAPLFGSHPDAKVLALALELQDPATSPVLDLGAGTGRNAFALARRGFPVDAVEFTPKFAEILVSEATRQSLPIRVVADDVFRASQALRHDYRLFFASEVVPDFRGTMELRRLFELAAEVLVEGGLLLFNVHMAVQGFTPERAAREFAQQCYSALFTPSEVKEAVTGLPFELVSNDSVYEYEMEHLPTDAWPPTPWFINWASGLDVYDLDRERCPIELRWLVFRRTDGAAIATSSIDSELMSGRATTKNVRSGRSRKLDPTLLRQALLRRLTRRAVASGRLTLPAIPAMLEQYVSYCFAVFGALGRKAEPEQLAQGKELFQRALEQAYNASPRSNIVVNYEVMMGTEVRYTVTADAVPIPLAYQDWLENLPEPLFGSHPDARLSSIVERTSDQNPGAVLDIGAGIGRNSLYLARRGHPVDAVEITPKFAEILASEVSTQRLSIRIIVGDVFERIEQLGREYSLILLSGVVGDFREFAQLRQIFELAAGRLTTGGRMILNVHVPVDGYTPDQAARQWGEQCCARMFTKSEIAQAMLGLPLEITSDDSAYDFEQRHLPEVAWPPTAAYSEWALGQHMYALERPHCPIELRWIVLEKT